MGTTRPRRFVFVLMPFTDDFDDVYKLGIKPACDEAGGYCERVDEQIFHESILERIYNQINKADLIIADMTGRNPNVFYETGYAHALGKKVILLTQKSEDIPFDLKHYPHVVYGGRISALKDALVTRVGWYLEQDQPAAEDATSHQVLEFYIGKQLITEGAKIRIPEADMLISQMGGPENIAYISNMSIEFSIHNPTVRRMNLDFDLGFLYPVGVQETNNEEMHETRLPDGRLLEEGSYMGTSINTQGWITTQFHLFMKGQAFLLGDELPMVMRLFFQEGLLDIPFFLVADDPA